MIFPWKNYQHAIWSAFFEIASKDFNKWFKIKKVSTGRWKSGTTFLVDRLLGKELYILA